MADQPASNPVPSPAPSPPPAARRSTPRAIGAALKNLFVRFYALLILLIVCWAGYTAVAYLVRIVFTPTPVPEQYRTWETAIAGFRPETMQLEGIGALVPRPPLGHYHQVERTLPVDQHNGCLTSGCHNPLAHTKRKEIRAFANLHATFLDCMLCHDARINGAVEAMWVDDQTGRPSGPPAVLELIKLLALREEEVRTQPAGAHEEIVGLLGAAVLHSADPVLKYLHAQLTTSEPGSPVWRHSIGQLQAELPNHVRGEYGAKLALKTPAERLSERNAQLAELARRYLAAPVNSDERERLDAQIHAGVLEKPSACGTCHGEEPARLDFAALGYPPDQAAALRDSAIARMTQQIREGQPFYLPRMLEGGRDER